MNFYIAWKGFRPEARECFVKLAGLQLEQIPDDLSLMDPDSRFKLKQHFRDCGLLNRFNELERIR